MYCQHCKTNNPDTARFCSNCGQELIRRCPNCQTEYPLGAHFCMACGEPVQEENVTDSARFSRLTAAVPRTLEQKIRAEAKSSTGLHHGTLGERRTVTTLLIDVVSSSSLSESLDLETWMEVMNRAFDLTAAVIYRYEGTIARMLGDSLLAFFGAPVAHEDDPQRAVRAGLEVISRIEGYSQEVKKAHGIDFAMRACINTGPIEIGPVDEDLTYDYTAFSGTVNLTSRIKFAGQAMSVILTGNTYPFVAPYFDFSDAGAVEMKGLEKPIRIFRANAPKAAPGRIRGFESLASPMVGRDDELSTLLHLCEAVRAGMGRAVIIAGEPGLGKTRLIQEWQQRAKNTCYGYWITGRCVSYGQGLAYRLIIDVIKNLLGVTDTSDEVETHKRLLTLTQDLLGDQIMEVYPYLGYLLSLKLEGEAFQRTQISDPLALRNQYLMAMQRLLQACMKKNPLVLVLEDLHWADASSVDLIIKLLPLVARWPILLCLVTRPEHDAPGWKLVTAAREQLGNSLTEISLNTLNEKDSRALVANLLEIETLPKHVRDLILRKAEGNPYFVEEVIRMLIDRGFVVRQEDAWIAQGEIPEHYIPDHLNGLLLARIDRLPAEARQTLLVASVIGRNFPVQVLSRIDSRSRTLQNDLSVLESSGFIHMANVEPELEYAFRHSMVQDAAYDLLLENDRRRLHEAVGEALEHLYPERRRELAGFLGYHFKEANLKERALKYFFMAGEDALASYANQEAENQYRRGLELTELSDEDKAGLYSGLGEALILQDRIDECIHAFQAVIDLYRSIGDFNGVGHSYSRVARAVWNKGDRPGSLQVCLEGMGLVKDAPDSRGKAEIFHETARSYFFTGNSDLALPLCQQALSMAERFKSVSVQADALATLGLLEGFQMQEKLDILQRAVDLAEANGLIGMASRAHINLGVYLNSWKADNQASMEHYLRAAELGRLRGEASQELHALIDYSDGLFRLGNLRKIIANIPNMEELAARISDPAPYLFQLKMIKAWLTGLEGNWEIAKPILREGLEVTRAMKNREYELILLNVLTRMFFTLSWWKEFADITEIEPLLQEALQLIGKGESTSRIWIYPSFVILKARQGHLEEAYLWLKKTRQAAESTPSNWDALYDGECEIEIAAAEQDWTRALAAAEKVARLEQQLKLRLFRAILLPVWADLYIRRGKPADLEQAQELLRESLEEYTEMGIGYLPKIAHHLLEVVQTKLHAQTIEHEQMTQEMKKARQVQESLLPEKTPQIPGWGLAASLEPARETSGDFYDFVALQDSRLGLVIADVTDKGTGAALFMALSRSIWRTFASNHPTQPEFTMQETNQRILADTHGGLFITLFYGILDPADGSFTYCSAGHHPAFLVRNRDGSIEQLERTGVPLGVFEDARWDKHHVVLEPGDTLVLYTDGVTDAQNAQEEYFGLERLQEGLKELHGMRAEELHKAVLVQVHNWMGEAAQFDDITLIVIVRDKE